MFSLHTKKIVIPLLGLLGVFVIVFALTTRYLIGQLDAKSNLIDYQNERIVQLQKNYDLLSKVSWINIIQHQIETNAHSNYFIVQKISFGGDTFTGKLSATIDVVMNPSSTKNLYKTLNQFNLNNDELTADLTRLMKAVSIYYNTFKSNNLVFPEWETGEFIVTIYNNEIGTFKNRQFSLKQ